MPVSHAVFFNRVVRLDKPRRLPNSYPGRQIKGDFIRRFIYPTVESSVNAANYKAAVADIGGQDDLDTHVFWDK